MMAIWLVAVQSVMLICVTVALIYQLYKNDEMRQGGYQPTTKLDISNPPSDGSAIHFP